MLASRLTEPSDSPGSSLTVFLFPWPLGHVRSNTTSPLTSGAPRVFFFFLLLRCSTRARPPEPQALLPFPDRRDLPFSLSCPLSESTPLAWPVETLSGDFRPGERCFFIRPVSCKKVHTRKSLLFVSPQRFLDLRLVELGESCVPSLTNERV